jgi:hypothetical protein
MQPKPTRAVDKSSLNRVIGLGCIWERKDFQPVGGSYILEGMVHFKSLRESIIMLTSWIFQVIFLFFYVGDNSRTNPIEEMGNDENQQAPLKDLLLEQDPRRSKKHLMGWFKRFGMIPHEEF